MYTSMDSNASKSIHNSRAKNTLSILPTYFSFQHNKIIYTSQ